MASSTGICRPVWGPAILAATIAAGSSVGQSSPPPPRILPSPVVTRPAPAPVVPLNATPPAAVDPSLVWPAPIPCEATPSTPPLPSYAGPLLERSTLTGNWFGTRDAIRDHGFTWDVSSTQFYQGVTTGGLQNGFAYGGRADYLLNINGEKAGLWKGLFIDLHGETNYGDSANGRTGALIPVNTAALFPTPNTPVTALTGVKITQALSENFVLFGGKINTLDGFDQPFTGGARGTNGFMNVAMVAPVVALRTIPYSAFGGGFAYLAGGEPVVSAMVLDPNNTPTVSGFDTFFDRGVSVLGSVNVPTNFFGQKGHQGVGFTYGNSQYTALGDLPFFFSQRLQGELPPLPRETGSWSLFYMFDQTIWSACDNPKRSWGVFGNLGLADQQTSPFRWAANVGVGGASPLASRPLDTFGIGYYYVGLNNSLKTLAPRLLPLRDEWGVELYYNVAVTPWFHLSPDLQIVTPARQLVDTSLIFGLRAKIDF